MPLTLRGSQATRTSSACSSGRVSRVHAHVAKRAFVSQRQTALILYLVSFGLSVLATLLYFKGI